MGAHEVTKTPESECLLALARRNAEAYVTDLGARAVMVTGSAAEGLSDPDSDLDVIVTYDALPDEEALARARIRNGGGERLWILGDRAAGDIAEAYRVAGVECQFGHATIAAWERDLDAVLGGTEVETPLQKALSGTLAAIPLHGEELIREWQRRIGAYPDVLARAMVRHHLRFAPLWLLHDRMATRDATIWRFQMLVEASHHLLGVLAGLNRLYFSSFQFKRMSRFVAEMRIAPPDLAARLERLFQVEPGAAALELESLVGETLALVATHLPDIDVTKAGRRLGERSEPWNPRAVREHLQAAGGRG